MIKISLESMAVENTRYPNHSWDYCIDYLYLGISTILNVLCIQLEAVLIGTELGNEVYEMLGRM